MQCSFVWLEPHSHNDENTVLNLLQELHTVLHRDELLTLLQVQRQGKWQRSGQQLGAEGILGPCCTSGPEVRSGCGPKAAMLGHNRRPGCVQE